MGCGVIVGDIWRVATLILWVMVKMKWLWYARNSGTLFQQSPMLPSHVFKLYFFCGYLSFCYVPTGWLVNRNRKEFYSSLWLANRPKAFYLPHSSVYSCTVIKTCNCHNGLLVFK